MPHHVGHTGPLSALSDLFSEQSKIIFVASTVGLTGVCLGYVLGRYDAGAPCQFVEASAPPACAMGMEELQRRNAASFTIGLNPR